ncbi:hypothetical protein ACIG87_30825 [Micromonospora sp. NPDC051925]|uniref:hypothetical protein n=1 Tax=Micromonospora sp. NPDC051925 TaxID=3364288 RepID=UPI0037C95876
MGDETTVELVLSPRDEAVQSGLSDAPGWSAFVTQLRDTLREVMVANRVDSLEVDELLVSQPLPDRYSHLRNGVQVGPGKAIDLIVGMVDGRGPYCRLSNAEGLRVDVGWDGAMHLSMTQEAARSLTDLAGGQVQVEWRRVRPEPPNDSRPVRAAADEEFWNAVRSAAEAELTLLCERWAHGAHGNTWFRVTPDNLTQVAGSIRPRSLVSIVVNPDLRLKVEIIDDGFAAFKAPLRPGELDSRSYFGGADSLDEVTSQGYSLMLGDSVLSRWCAVVPDPDGEVRGSWKDREDSCALGPLSIAAWA